ncbi:hypothetical protein TNCV_1520161 [Trichonephila clavipes]|nr:hypothetical protein TNCV_1520161 [Trichonephila clavipes]
MSQLVPHRTERAVSRKLVLNRSCLGSFTRGQMALPDVPLVTFSCHTAESRLLLVDRITPFLCRRAPLKYCKDLSLAITPATFDTNLGPPCDAGGVHYATGYGHDLVTRVSQFRVLAQLKTRSVEQWSPTSGPCQVIYSQFGLTIHQNDHQVRRRFVEWAQNEIAVVPDFHKRILFNDEAHFWLNGYVNKQNCRIWSEANPQVYVETPLHPEKLTVWCALWAGGILLQKRGRPQRYSQW